MSSQGRSVHSVEKAIVLLDCFRRAGGSLSLSELVQQTGWAKSTVHGLLASMLPSAVVEQDRSDGRYRLGYHLFELGSAVAAGWDVVGVVRPYLEKLAQDLGKSAYLARLSGEELILAECVEPRSGLRISQEPGSRLPLHGSSQGKCILAAMPPEQAKALLRRKGMPRFTPHTITDWESLQPQLVLTRELGYAVEREEFQPGLQSVGAPVYTGSGSCIYAIGIVGIQPAGQTAADHAAIRAVREAARSASQELGWREDDKCPTGGIY